MVGRMRAGPVILWLSLYVCIQDVAQAQWASADDWSQDGGSGGYASASGYWVCSGLCADGTRVTNPRGNDDMIRTTDSECGLAVSFESCTGIATSAIKFLTYGPFRDREAAVNFRIDFLVASETYWKSNKNVLVAPTTTTAPAPAVSGIPAECRTGTRRATVETITTVDKAVGEATCSCHDFVKTTLLVSSSLNMIPIFLANENPTDRLR
jgi:hypothetical protein